MKKTLIVTLELPPMIGGIATYIDRLAGGLDPEQTIVVAPPHPDAEEWDVSRSYKIIRTPLLFPKFIWPRWLRMCFVLKRIAKEEGVEVMLIHHVLPVGYAARFVKKFIGIPFVVFSHGTDIISATNHWWKKKMVQKIIAQSEHVFVNSESLKRRFLRPLPAYTNRVSVLYPCPEEDFFVAPPAEQIEELRSRLALKGKKVVLSVARMVDGKGFPHLADVMVQISKTDPNAVWVIIGDGPKKDEVLGYLQKQSLQNIVRYIGQVPHDQLKPYYYLADVFALLTHPDHGFEEGLGLVFLEAAASGIPVVAGKSGGVEEAVAHMQTGIMVDAYQHQQAIDAIVGLLKDSDFAERLGSQAKERVRAQFNWDHQLNRLETWLS